MDPEDILDASSATEDPNKTDATGTEDQAAPELSPADATMAALGFGETEDSSTSDADETSTEGATEDESDADETAGSEDDAGEDAGASDDADDDEDAPFHKHPRFQQLVAQKNAATEKADQFDKLVDYMKGKSLGVDEIEDGLALIAALKNPNAENAAEQLQALKPFVDKLRARTGQGDLPADLAEEVEAGTLSEARARELVKQRAELEATQEQSRLTSEKSERETAEAAQAAAIRSIQNSVAAEEAGWASDSKIDQKMPLIKAEMQSLIKDFGFPKSAEAAVRLTKMAKSAVDAKPEFQAKPKTPVRTLTGSQPKTETPEPKSPREASMRVLGF